MKTPEKALIEIYGPHMATLMDIAAVVFANSRQATLKERKLLNALRRKQFKPQPHNIPKLSRAATETNQSNL